MALPKERFFDVLWVWNTRWFLNAGWEKPAPGVMVTSIYRGPILLTYDPRYNALDGDDLPVLEAKGMRRKPVGFRQHAQAVDPVRGQRRRRPGHAPVRLRLRRRCRDSLSLVAQGALRRADQERVHQEEPPAKLSAVAVPRAKPWPPRSIIHSSPTQSAGFWAFSARCPPLREHPAANSDSSQFWP